MSRYEPNENTSPQTPPIDSTDNPNDPIIEHDPAATSLTGEFIRQVDEAVEANDKERVEALSANLHPADMADLLEQLDGEARQKLVQLLGRDLDADALPELDEDVRDDVIEVMPPEQLAEAVSEMDTDDAAFVLEDMNEADRAEVLAGMSHEDRIALQAALSFEEDTAGRIMQREFFAAPPFWTVGQIIDRLRSSEDLPDVFYEVFVVDPNFEVIGEVPLSLFLKAPRDKKMSELMGSEKLFRIPVDMDQEEVAYLFEKYNLISAPVVDKSNRLVGMITVDDVVEIIQEESHEDMLALAGVDTNEDGLSGDLFRATRSRFTWLGVNLFTAIMASLVIAIFNGTIEQAVAVAILMPIVASMGGNAGTQTLTIAVRNLATKDLTGANAWRVIGREVTISLLNGAAFAVLMGSLAALWYYFTLGDGNGDASMRLGLVLGAAMVFNMICAGLAGILVPLGLVRAGADPAVSSPVLVTTVTDVVGFFSFLGLATLFFIQA